MTRSHKGYYYVGPFRYKRDEDGAYSLDKVRFGGGEIIADSTGRLGVAFIITDHLESVRLKVNEDGEIIGSYDYLPYGMLASTSSGLGKDNATLLAEKYPSISPYAYCAGNPVNLVDPDGKDWFQNIYTGELYYNANFTKKSLGQDYMFGTDGWVYFGANGMFNKSDSDLIKYASSKSEVGGYVFNVNDASRTMSMVDYSRKPLEADVFVKDVSYRHSEGESTINQPGLESYTTVEKVYSSIYVKNSALSSYSVDKIFDKDFDINFWALSITFTQREHRRYQYSDKIIDKINQKVIRPTFDILSIMSDLLGNIVKRR